MNEPYFVIIHYDDKDKIIQIIGDDDLRHWEKMHPYNDYAVYSSQVFSVHSLQGDSWKDQIDRDYIEPIILRCLINEDGSSKVRNYVNAINKFREYVINITDIIISHNIAGKYIDTVAEKHGIIYS